MFVNLLLFLCVLRILYYIPRVRNLGAELMIGEEIRGSVDTFVAIKLMVILKKYLSYFKLSIYP